MALDKANIAEKQIGFLVEISTCYEELERIKYQIKAIGGKIISIKYDANANILVEISKKNYEENLLKHNKSGKYCINLKILKEKNVDI